VTTRRGSTPSREPRAREKRDRIIEAARDVCNRKGFEATRMEEIAQLAAVSKGTLYNFFESKEDLFVDAVLLSYAEFGRVLPAVEDASLEPLARLDALIESLADSFDDICQEILLAHQAWSVALRAPAAREKLMGALRAIYAEFSARLENILRAGIERGQLRSDLDVDVAVATWLATFDGLLYRASFEDRLTASQCTPRGVRRSLGWLLEQMRTVPDSSRVDTHHPLDPGHDDRQGGAGKAAPTDPAGAEASEAER
jgi:AcrR family transcriptional regulator